jgi:hypothetical protein
MFHTHLCFKREGIREYEFEFCTISLCFLQICFYLSDSDLAALKCVVAS